MPQQVVGSFISLGLDRFNPVVGNFGQTIQFTDQQIHGGGVTDKRVVVVQHKRVVPLSGTQQEALERPSAVDIQRSPAEPLEFTQSRRRLIVR